MASAIKMLTESEAQAKKKLEFSSTPNVFGLIGVGLAAGIVAALAWGAVRLSPYR
jgi:hypothetical protein